MATSMTQARKQIAAGKHSEALITLCEILDREPENADAWLASGAAMIALGQARDAEQALQVANQLQPQDWRIHHQLGNAYSQIGLRDRPEQAYRVATQLAPSQVEPWVSLGFCLIQRGAFNEAGPVFGEALTLDPTHPGAAAGAAEVLTHLRDRDSAWKLLEPHLELAVPEPRVAITAAKLARSTEQKQALIRPLTRCLEKQDVAGIRTSLHHALGDVYDAVGDTDAAFVEYQNGNKSRNLTFEIADHERTLGLFPTIFPVEFFERPSPAPTSDRPILICGAMRSGTSLTEQILACHADVGAGGELEAIRDLAIQAAKALGTTSYLQALDQIDGELEAALGQAYLDFLGEIDPEAVRVTDKMPNNFFHLGLVARMLPGARIIHVVRDPLDTCWSCFRQHFKAAHSHTTNLEWLGRWYAAYRRLMAHWEEVLPNPMLTVRYEALVSEPEEEVRRLLDFLELPFDPACLEPHKNRRGVGTASEQQVRAPIHKGWIGRSRAYREHLQPLIDALGEWAPADITTQD